MAIKPVSASGGSNLTGIAQYNERLILQLIRRSGNLTKAEITRLTNLSAQTASVIINRLIDEALLYKQERRYETGKVGQPAVPIALNPEGAYSIGVKIGRRSLDIVLIDFIGTILKRMTHAYSYPDPNFIFPHIHQAIDQLTRALTARQLTRLKGIGVAAPYGLGGWQQETATPSNITQSWNSIDIRHTIQQDQPYPVWLVNDATAACIASLELGNPHKFDNYLHIFVGTFIGGGLIMNHTLYTGCFNNAGAIGSMPLPADYAADPQRTGKTVQLINCASLYLLDRSLQTLGTSTEQVWQLLLKERALDKRIEQVLSAWINQSAHAIAYAITATISVIDLEGVIIDGSLPATVAQQLTEAVQAALLHHNTEGLILPNLVAGDIGNDARALGGAFLPFYTNFAPERSLLISSASNSFDHFNTASIV
ncbi:ROK family transcriptional regulator [Thiolinea disciformis]|uniref:ROK family transcriptional regulator n=1 Tax=Thiolinea disciformis TaxID=125614 RepID=UPI0003631021|nr:ROK family transcriptional regulator [Thiolinea disciformis]